MSTTTTSTVHAANDVHDDNVPYVPQSTATTPGLDIPGAFPKTHVNRSQAETTQGESGSIGSTASGILTAAGQYFPTSVMDRLKGVGIFSTNSPQDPSDVDSTATTTKPTLPSQESNSNFEPTRTAGVGSLPGTQNESAVAQLPHEREVEAQAKNMSVQSETTNSVNRAEAKQPPAVIVNDPSYDRDPHAGPNATLAPPQAPHPSNTNMPAPPVNGHSNITNGASSIPIPDTPGLADNASIVPIPPSSKAPSTSTTYTSTSTAAPSHSDNKPHDKPFREPAQEPQERTHAFGGLGGVTGERSEDKPLPVEPHVRELTEEEKQEKARRKEEERLRRMREPAQERGHGFASPSESRTGSDLTGSSPTRRSASSDVEEGHVKGHGRKPSFGQKFKGEMKVIAGKLTGDARKVEQGKAMKHGDI